MTTRDVTIKTPHGNVNLPAGLRVKPAGGSSLFLSPMEGLFILDDVPESLFPAGSALRECAERGHILLDHSQIQQ